MGSITVTLVSGNQPISVITDNIRYVIESGSGSIVYTDGDNVYTVTESASSVVSAAANLATLNMADGSTIYVNPSFVLNSSEFGSGAAIAIAQKIGPIIRGTAFIIC